MPGSAGLSGDWLSIRDSSWKRSGLSSPPPRATIDKTDAGGLATVLWEIAQASGGGRHRGGREDHPEAGGAVSL